MSADGKKDPVMPVYGRDFYDDEAVIRMSLEQEAVYWRLLWHAWREGSIPDVPGDIALIVAAKVSPRQFVKLWPGIAPKWMPSPELRGRLINKRQEHERRERRERARKLSENGRAGNEARWGGDRPAIANTSLASDRPAIPSTSTSSVGGSEEAAPPDPDRRNGTDAIRECLLELGVLRLSAKKLAVLAGKIAASGWSPGDLRRLADQVKGKTQAQRSARLAGLLQDDENRDVAIRSAASSSPAATLTHPQNMPLGVASCGCAECVNFRSKRNGGAA